MTEKEKRAQLAKELGAIISRIARDMATLCRATAALLDDEEGLGNIRTTLTRYAGERKQVCGPEVAKAAKIIAPKARKPKRKRAAKPPPLAANVVSILDRLR